MTSPGTRGGLGLIETPIWAATSAGQWSDYTYTGTFDGTTAIYQDGSLVTGRVTDRHFEADDVPPGCHVFSTAPGAAPGHDARLTGICASGYAYPPAAEQLDHLKTYVAALPVTAGARNALTAKLVNGAAFYGNQPNKQAVSMLDAFVSEVDSLHSDAVLTTEQAGNLIGAATTVIDTHLAS